MTAQEAKGTTIFDPMLLPCYCRVYHGYRYAALNSISENSLAMLLDNELIAVHLGIGSNTVPLEDTEAYMEGGTARQTEESNAIDADNFCKLNSSTSKHQWSE
jgi:hypothetical protein